MTPDPHENHHYVCGCGDCACHGWDSNHYGVQYSCQCGSQEAHDQWEAEEAYKARPR